MLTTTTSTRPEWQRSTAILNRLILACHDGADTRRAAALIVRGRERRSQLEDGADKRLAFAEELGELVRSFGGTPTDHGSKIEGIRAAAHRINVLLVGDNSGDAYGTCARVEGSAEHLYETAIKADLPGPAHLTLVRQYGEIATDHAELRRLSMGG